MATLKEMLADKANFQDNLVITLPGGQVATFGQLRGLDADTRAAIEKQDKDIQTRKAALDAEEAKFKTSQAATAELYVTLTQAVDAVKAGRMNDPAIAKLFAGAAPPANLATPATDPFAVLAKYEADPLMGPVVNMVKHLRDQLTVSQNVAAKLTEANQQMAKSYINGVMEDRYERLVPADKQDKFTMAALIDKAVKANQFSSDGTPNIKWAYRDLSAPDAAAAREAEIRADERKKLEKELADRAAGGTGGSEVFIPAPSTFGLDVHNRSGKAVKGFASLDKAFEAAAKDPAMWSQEGQA